MQYRLKLAGAVRRKTMLDCDMLLVPAIPDAVADRRDVLRSLDDAPTTFDGLTRFTAVFDMTGQPTLSLNGGFDAPRPADGLPAGRAAARRGATVQAGHAFQGATELARAPPDTFLNSTEEEDFRCTKSPFPPISSTASARCAAATTSMPALDMSKVAHVVVDMQVGFVEVGAPIEVPMTREIYGTINTISEAVRQAGGVNVFTRYTYDPAEKHSWDHWFKTLGASQLDGQAKMARRQAGLGSRPAHGGEGRRHHRRQDPLLGADPRDLRHGCPAQGARASTR